MAARQRSPPDAPHASGGLSHYRGSGTAAEREGGDGGEKLSLLSSLAGICCCFCRFDRRDVEDRTRVARAAVTHVSLAGKGKFGAGCVVRGDDLHAHGRRLVADVAAVLVDPNVGNAARSKTNGLRWRRSGHLVPASLVFEG